MAKVKKNVVVRGMSGKAGELVFRQLKDGSTVVAVKQDFSHRKFSEGQVAHQARMREAAAYGREAQHHPVYVALAEKSTLTGYNWAFGDRMKPPVIHKIERAEGLVRVRASDNVGVVRVEVQVLDESGAVQTRGEAVQCATEVWEFGTELAGKVVVRVWDLAQNVVEGSLE